MEIKIESASIKLLDELCKIEEQCFEEEAFSKRQIAYLLTDYNTIALVAKSNSIIAGFIIAQVEIENNTLYGHIITINVPPILPTKRSRKQNAQRNGGNPKAEKHNVNATWKSAKTIQPHLNFTRKAVTKKWENSKTTMEKNTGYT